MQLKANLEYGWLSMEAQALKIRIYSTGIFKNARFHDNQFIASADAGQVHAAISARIKIDNSIGSSSGNLGNILFDNNLFKSITKTVNSGYRAYSVDFSGVDAGTGIYFGNNILESNDISLVFGDNDSWGLNNDGIVFLGNTIRKSADPAASSVSHTSVFVGDQSTSTGDMIYLFDNI